MRPRLHNLPLIKHINHIRPLDGTQPMRHSNSRPALSRRIQRSLHHLLRLRVQRRRSFIEEQNPRIADQGARDGDALFLAP
jgi:hypothetical protein